MQTPVCRECVPVCESVIFTPAPTHTHTHTQAAGLSVTFNDPLRRPQSGEPACHPFPIRESLLGLAAGHDRWRTSMVRLKLDLNRRPFGPGDKVTSVAGNNLPACDAPRSERAGGRKAERGQACNKGERTHSRTSTHARATHEERCVTAEVQLLPYEAFAAAL